MLDAESLSTPSWCCVHFVPAEVVRTDLIAALDSNAVAQFNMKGAAIRTSMDLFRELASTMAFPSYFGMNWDAAEECLRDIGEWRPANGYVLFIHDAEWLWRHVFASMGKLVETWQAAAEEWAQDDTSFHLVFVIDGQSTSTA